LTFVAMMEPSDFGPRHDPTSAGRVDGAGFGRVLAEREVRARALVVRDVGVKDSPEMPLIEGDDVVQALAADRPDHAFDGPTTAVSATCTCSLSWDPAEWRRCRAACLNGETVETKITPSRSD
jgi:hypothetical protein